MTGLTITPLYAAILALLFVGLTLRVVRLRWKFRIGIGTGEERVLAKAVRAHGNAAETIPLALVLMLLVELGPVQAATLHWAGAALVVGRCAHAFGLSRHAGTSAGRMVGMFLTLAVVLFLAGILIGRVVASTTN
ncbi:MAG: MAPEG family protein [Gammaproteobacteria bacterium]